jgi:hypothetical protein
VLGILPDDVQKQLEAAAASQPALREQIECAAEAIALLGPQTVRPKASGRGRDRLLATLAGPDRFKEFFPLLCEWFDLSEDALRAVIVKMDGGTEWKTTPFPGMLHFDFPPGPHALGSVAGCLLLRAGAHFPPHRHVGVERSLILQGTLLLEGKDYRVGDVVEAASDTVHDFSAAPGRDLIFMVSRDKVSFRV